MRHHLWRNTIIACLIAISFGLGMYTGDRLSVLDAVFTMDYHPPELAPPNATDADTMFNLARNEHIVNEPAVEKATYPLTTGGDGYNHCYSIERIRTAWAIHQGGQHRQFASRKEAVNFAQTEWGCK